MTFVPMAHRELDPDPPMTRRQKIGAVLIAVELIAVPLLACLFFGDGGTL